MIVRELGLTDAKPLKVPGAKEVQAGSKGKRQEDSEDEGTEGVEALSVDATMEMNMMCVSDSVEEAKEAMRAAGWN